MKSPEVVSSFSTSSRQAQNPCTLSTLNDTRRLLVQAPPLAFTVASRCGRKCSEIEPLSCCAGGVTYLEICCFAARFIQLAAALKRIYGVFIIITTVFIGTDVHLEVPVDSCRAAAMTLRTVLLSLQALLAAAEPDDPQDAVVANQYKQNPEMFKQTARLWSHVYAGAPVSSSEYARKIDKLCSMGFDKNAVIVALSSKSWDVETATEVLLNN
ncbi:ubiquitin-conjugating enzyme E2Kb (UBC1 homolog, yeast) isoform X1 [Trichomycterus rosablanca]|uniref:ubiquitin-conjugating enzyme E2Kb (UBC1 homolog, yeast) isoform X1 n=1 Tax=Trichomycterus rosablanca TaxID=2290929 RepID=UPI002F351CEC